VGVAARPPGRRRPVVRFTYGRSYLAREDAIALYLPELPLGRGPISPLVGDVAGAIADAAPDAWGQRVILNCRVGRSAGDTVDLSLLTYLLESGSDRIGALDFQASATEYVARSTGDATLTELAQSADRVEQGIPLSPALDQALLHGSSVGGARPKALLSDGARRLIAKFSSTTDTYPVVKGEFPVTGARTTETRSTSSWRIAAGRSSPSRSRPEHRSVGADLRAMSKLRDAAGDRFVAGLVRCTTRSDVDRPR